MFDPFYFVLSLVTSVVGSICGIGGGIIIKPLLDSMKVMSVDTVSFLSGSTVLCMSVVSVLRAMRGGGAKIELGTSTPLAIGAVLGGLSGQWVFQALKRTLPHLDYLGAAQALALLLTLSGALCYTIFERKIPTFAVRSISICLAAGLLLGIVSSFIGIGGGPINLVVLSLLFSMGTKQAAANSMYIVMFSQIASSLHVALTRSVPPFDLSVLITMACGGIGGALIGSAVNKKITSASVRKLFISLMLVVICMSAYNLLHFMAR